MTLRSRSVFEISVSILGRLRRVCCRIWTQFSPSEFDGYILEERREDSVCVHVDARGASILVWKKGDGTPTGEAENPGDPQAEPAAAPCCLEIAPKQDLEGIHLYDLLKPGLRYYKSIAWLHAYILAHVAVIYEITEMNMDVLGFAVRQMADDQRTIAGGIFG